MAIDVQENDTLVDNVTVRATDDRGAFGKGVWVRPSARGASVTRLRATHGSGIWASTGRVASCSETGVAIGGDGIVESCNLLGVWAWAASRAVIRRNEVQGRVTIFGALDAPPAEPGPVLADNRILSGLSYEDMYASQDGRNGYGSGLIENNRILGGLQVRLTGGSPVIRGNTIRADTDQSLPDCYVLYLRGGVTPLFERNTFGSLGLSHRGLPAGFVDADADFGGGPQGSVGQNHFGPVVGGIEFDCSRRTTIHAATNYWRGGIIQDYYAGCRPVSEGPPWMVDPLTNLPEI
jgi:hypothetical protein